MIEPEVYFVLPDLNVCSDERLEELFQGLDGPWSSATKTLKARFGADKLDLDENWAGTPTWWSCPACRRPKSDIARVSEAGVLLCRLDWHHDHLRNAGKAALRRTEPAEATQEQRIAWLRAVDLCKPLLERFNETLVCSDCNAADAKAKTSLGDRVPKDFSFSPAEVAAFVKPRPNAPHQIDAGIAADIWEKVKPDYEDLLAFADLLAVRLAAGRHRKEGGTRTICRGQSAAEIVLRLAEQSLGHGIERSTLEAGLRARSVARDGIGSSRRAGRRPPPAPTSAELDAFAASQPTWKPWSKAGDEWRCAVCERSRRQIVRRSNNRQWTATIHKLPMYVPERSPRSLAFRNPDDTLPYVFGDVRAITVCQDCRLLVTLARSKRSDLDEGCLRPGTLKELVGCLEPHEPVELDADTVLAAANDDPEYLAAVNDFHRHWREARAAAADVSRLVHGAGFTRGDAVAHLADLAVDPFDDSPAPRARERERLQWLLSEAERLDDRSRHGVEETNSG